MERVRLSLMQEERKFKKKQEDQELNEIQNRKTKEKKSIKPNVDSLKDQPTDKSLARLTKK